MGTVSTNISLQIPTVYADEDQWGILLNQSLNTLDAIFEPAGAGTGVGLNIGAGKTLNSLGSIKSSGSFTQEASTLSTINIVSTSTNLDHEVAKIQFAWTQGGTPTDLCCIFVDKTDIGGISYGTWGVRCNYDLLPVRNHLVIDTRVPEAYLTASDEKGFLAQEDTLRLSAGPLDPNPGFTYGPHYISGRTGKAAPPVFYRQSATDTHTMFRCGFDYGPPIASVNFPGGAKYYPGEPFQTVIDERGRPWVHQPSPPISAGAGYDIVDFASYISVQHTSGTDGNVSFPAVYLGHVFPQNYVNVFLLGFIRQQNNVVALFSLSDERSKKDIVDMPPALERVRALRPRRFKMLADPDETEVEGFVANEVKDLAPDAVATQQGPDGVPTNYINLAGLVPVLTQGLKDLDGEVTSLKATIQALTDRIEALESPGGGRGN